MEDDVMDTSSNRRSGRLGALAAAIVLTGAGLLVLGAAGTPARTGIGSHAISATAIGEHSALGARRVEELNAAIAAMQRLRGEHAGLTKAEYLAAAALDGGR
jgi:hypothetical protein